MAQICSLPPTPASLIFFVILLQILAPLVFDQGYEDAATDVTISLPFCTVHCKGYGDASGVLHGLSGPDMTMGATEEERLVVCTKLCNYKLQATAGFDAMFRPVEWSGFPVGFRQVSGRFHILKCWL